MNKIQTLEFRTITGYILFAYLKSVGPHLIKAGISRPWPVGKQPVTINYEITVKSARHRGSTFVNASAAFAQIQKFAHRFLMNIEDTSQHRYLYIDNPAGTPLLSVDSIQANFKTRQIIKILGKNNAGR